MSIESFVRQSQRRTGHAVGAKQGERAGYGGDIDAAASEEQMIPGEQSFDDFAVLSGHRATSRGWPDFHKIKVAPIGTPT